ncbi:agmatine deiminase family protein [Nesterenkonia sp. DZ6]|uniref:agmatine deiminase family protein n=1 Tax=Nesterenkonia sp. DZ6 TaxID=2901229 RepID=UPI001F4D1026|nr:agmatine deiminase family protein [Nesterenkonia sp. DZ6]MCH8560178.1 agmatine deiminase family protein [Nesterenkonia sp. DZ6]
MTSPHDPLRMPPEWAPHDRTWMAFPPANATFGDPGSDTLDAVRAAWGRVARVIADHEPVTVVADPLDLPVAHELLGDAVTLRPMPLDDAWMRDIGPTFVHRADGELAAVDWAFNGWGAQSWANWTRDQHIAAAVTAVSGAARVTSLLVNEGGGFHVDGRGTVLLTETVQRDVGRNPGQSHEQIEAEIHAALGTTHAVWFPRGLTRDYEEYGTRGHVDMFAAFTPSGSILLHRQDDPAHPDYEVTRELRAFLETAHDAAGDPFRIIDVPAPATILDDGEHVDWTYINHYVANGVVALCAYDDPNDDTAAAILAEAYPDRRIELLDARDILRFGGGIHCITQQQPSAVSHSAPLSLVDGETDR